MFPKPLGEGGGLNAELFINWHALGEPSKEQRTCPLRMQFFFLGGGTAPNKSGRAWNSKIYFFFCSFYNFHILSVHYYCSVLFYCEMKALKELISFFAHLIISLLWLGFTKIIFQRSWRFLVDTCKVKTPIHMHWLPPYWNMMREIFSSGRTKH